MDANRARLLDLAKEAREQCGLGRQIALIKATGLSKSTIHRFEQGEPIDESSLRAISRAIGWTADSGADVLAGGDPTVLEDAVPASKPPIRDAFAELRDRLPLRATHALETGRIFDSLTYDLTPTGGARVISVVVVDEGAESDLTPDERARIGRAWEIAQRRLLGLPPLAWEPGDPEEE